MKVQVRNCTKYGTYLHISDKSREKSLQLSKASIYVTQSTHSKEPNEWFKCVG